MNRNDVEDAAMAGNRESVVLALVDLAQVAETQVRRILACGRAQPLVALVWHARLPMRAAFKIQTAIMKLPASSLLAARDGVGFPLTPEDMRRQLSFFDVVAR